MAQFTNKFLFIHGFGRHKGILGIIASSIERFAVEIRNLQRTEISEVYEFFKKKHSVAILDFTAWIYPDYWKKYSSNVCKCEELITISSKNDFLSIVQESDNIIVMDFLGNNKKLIGLEIK